MENIIAMNFEPQEYANIDQSIKIGIHENKAIHNILCISQYSIHRNLLKINGTSRMSLMSNKMI